MLIALGDNSMNHDPNVLISIKIPIDHLKVDQEFMKLA